MRCEAHELVGRQVGPYVLDRLLGQGGFAWVFAAHGAAGDGRYAVKVLKPRYAGDAQFESRFRNEATVAAGLSHPNIVRIHDIGTDRGLTFFAMDLCDDSLASLVARDGPLAEERLLAVAIDVAGALEYAHGAGIVHRDLKVDNILVDAEGRAVLTDFGIARTVAGYVTATGANMTIGTPAYVSPEQAQGRPLDGRSDLYALGVSLYKAATGDLPFRSADWFELARMHVEDPPLPPRTRRPGLSPRLERMILRCLAKHPDDRYASAAALLSDLRGIAASPTRSSEIPIPQPLASAPGVIAVWGAGRPWLLRTGAMVLIAVVALLVMWLMKR
jgi:serine/threonine protein kinase